MDIGALGIYVCLFFALYFEVFLLVNFFEKRPSQKTGLPPKQFPTVAIVVPCFNEQRTLAATILSLLALDYPKEKFSIVIVNDGSTDGTHVIGEHFAAHHEQVSYFRKENGGKYTALNFAIERTQSDIIGCLDADSFVAPDALLETIKAFEADPAAMAATPAMQVYRPRKVLERMQSVEYTFGIFYKKMFDNLAAINVLPGPFSLYRRDIFKKIGLFRHAYNTEDMEIAFRMHANGMKIINAHTAFVYTTVPSTLRALLRQRVRWSQGFLQNARDYSYMFFNRRYGNFGVLVLPFALSAFFAGIYTAGYAFYKLGSLLVGKALDMWATHIPPHVGVPQHVGWFYINTSMLTFLILMTLGMTVVAVVLGQRISKNSLGLKSFLSYFVLFGIVAPLWLARAAWGAALARESKWR